MIKKQLFFLGFLLCYFFAFGTQRTLYVDNFSTILGNPTKEDKLLTFASRNNFNTLILYQLNKIDKLFPLTDASQNSILADFIAKAKTKFGVLSIGASGESAEFFVNRIDLYNNSRKKSKEKFDIYNLEYEYWSSKASGVDGYYCINYLEENSIPCGREGSFKFFIDNLKQLKKLAKNSNHPIEVEAYVGFYTDKEISLISQFCDRLSIIAFGKSPALSFSAAKRNLDNLYKTNSKIKASILFSTSVSNLGRWLKFDTLDTNEKMFFSEMNSKNSQLKKKINFKGFSYHTYTDLEKSMSYYSYTRN